ncbi:MAG TPA: hypothetical protein VHR41_12990 [Gemmatimonadales bacterium]|jgi:hypothetical protein|nr:hypothetical protein [Gemmatimonadales bacterium]
MRTKLATAIALLALVGCNQKNRETGAAGNGDTTRSGTDTMIQSSRIKDTTVVKKDTSIDVDTTKKTDHIKKNQ